MPEFYVNHVRRKGPLFANPTERVERFLIDSQRAIAEETKARVLRRLSIVLRNPTGDYESNIQVTRVANDFAVNDNKSVKGGWLEGISSRNKVTSFKGYHTFRTVSRAIERELPVLLRPHVQRLITELNG